MRRYQPYTPASKSNKPITQSMREWAESRESLSASEIEAEEKREEEEERERENTRRIISKCLTATPDTTKSASSEEGSISFTLKTATGTLSYKPTDYSNYTDFLRVVIELSLAFNPGEIDPEFKKCMKRAFEAYENGEDFDEEYDNSDSDEYDFVPAAIENARHEAANYEKSVQYINALPKSETLTLKILQPNSEFTKTRDVEKILSKMTDLPPNVMHEVVHNNQSFTMPFEKASEVYVQLRMLSIPLTLKSGTSEVQASKTTTKSAAKKSTRSIKKTTSSRSKKTSAKRSSVKSSTSTVVKTLQGVPTGREKLRATVGIIGS
jgi:hypothetical protein